MSWRGETSAHEQDDENEGEVDPLAPAGTMPRARIAPVDREIQADQHEHAGQDVGVDAGSNPPAPRKVEIGPTKPKDQESPSAHGKRASLPSCLT